jgi:hypothetical protein
MRFGARNGGGVKVSKKIPGGVVEICKETTKPIPGVTSEEIPYGEGHRWLSQGRKATVVKVSDGV